LRCLVIGGSGFIGVAACRELMRRGVETIAAGRSPRPYGTFTRHVAFDRRERSELAMALETVEPDVVLDLAAFTPSDVAAFMELFGGKRYVFVSTGVYPHLDGRPAREEDFVPLEGAPPSFDEGETRGDLARYLDGKRWCETLLARSGGFPWVSVRPPAVFGADDHTLRIAAYLQRVEDGGPLLVPAESFERQAGLAWSRDVGYACALACDLSRHLQGAYNVAFDGVSLRRLIESIGRAMGREARLVPIPFAEMPPAASPYGPDPRRSAGYDLSRSRRELGFEPSTLEDALAEVLAWYQVRRPTHPGYRERGEELRLAGGLRGLRPG
jgi:nucleoside-diphosphate-sugar epimerase